MKKAEHDLIPMIQLEGEALAIWMMGDIILPSPPVFWSARTREQRG